MPFQIIHQDITKISCDAIVNPSDCLYSGGGGTDYAVHAAAGPELDIECSRKPMLRIADVAVTDAYRLPCKYILHTFGPLWIDGDCNEENLLRACYMNALIAARKLNAESVAFPLISAGTFGFPKDKVLRIALRAISDFLSLTEQEMMIWLCVFDKQAYEISERLALERFLYTGYDYEESYAAPICAAPMERAAFSEEKLCCDAAPELDLSDWIKKQDESFAVTLLKLIDRRGMTDVQCYKKANVSKQTFWKICNDAKYKPTKPTVLAFAIALELDYDETQQLLKTVGLSLSHSNTFDMIIEFYIRRGNYDIFEINSALYQYDQLCLGC